MKRQQPRKQREKTRYFDPETMSAKFGGPKLTLAIAKIYLEESPPVVEKFRLAGQEPMKFDDIDSCAHQLKGSLGMLGSSLLTSLAEKLQHACRARSEAETRTCYLELLEGLDNLNLEIEGYVSSSSSVDQS